VIVLGGADVAVVAPARHATHQIRPSRQHRTEPEKFTQSPEREVT
jgi:hypothetical protein